MKRAKKVDVLQKKEKSLQRGIEKERGRHIEVRKHRFGVRTPFHQTRCTRLAALTPVNQYRKLRKKQTLAKCTYRGRRTMYCTLRICESSSFRPAVPNLAYMHPQGYICLSEGVHLRLAKGDKNIFTYDLFPNIYTYVS